MLPRYHVTNVYAETRRYLSYQVSSGSTQHYQIMSIDEMVARAKFSRSEISWLERGKILR